ncbi:protein NYNRIN-like [Latimeria chalumnae]|uniref:protein NYNRIN-like n=1 Tax=Latimeria chalumnae TaxID=7897 RepID=UPI00313AF2F6
MLMLSLRMLRVLLHPLRVHPSPLNRPQKGLRPEEELKTVISCYNPNWADMNQLLRVILPSELRQRLFQVGHEISQGKRALTSSRVCAILRLPRPISLSQMRTLLGMAGYCRQWIPNYALLVKPLQSLTHLSTPEPLPWDSAAEDSFVRLKQALSSAPALGLPDYKKPFFLYCHSREGFASGVLTQQHGDRQRPVAYYSSPLDPVAAAFPPCLRAIAAAALLLERSSTLVLGSSLTLAVPHDVAALLLRTKTQYISSSRLTKYEMLLLSAPNVTLTRCPVLNPASLLPTPCDGEPHDCLLTTAQLTSPRPDLQDVPLHNPDLVFFVDGSCQRNDQGLLVAGYSVCSPFQVVENAPLPSVTSAQVAELVALTRACILATGKSVNIYTDSRYAFGVVHDYGQLWKQRGFLTSAGVEIRNGSYVSALLDALMLPSAISVIKCMAHLTADDDVTKGNALADAAAKAAALSASQERVLLLQPHPFTKELTTLDDLALIQDRSPEPEKTSWYKQPYQKNLTSRVIPFTQVIGAMVFRKNTDDKSHSRTGNREKLRKIQIRPETAAVDKDGPRRQTEDFAA